KFPSRLGKNIDVRRRYCENAQSAARRTGAKITMRLIMRREGASARGRACGTSSHRWRSDVFGELQAITPALPNVGYDRRISRNEPATSGVTGRGSWVSREKKLYIL